MNPLLSNDTFYLTLANPNPTSSKTKEGPIYRISVEVSREEWDWFMEAETKGMVIECACQVSHKNESRDPNTVDAFTGKTDSEHKQKGGPLSVRSDVLARDTGFHEFLATQCNVVIENEDDARNYIRSYCNVNSRAELDHNDKAGSAFKGLLSRYVRWSNAD